MNALKQNCCTPYYLRFFANLRFPIIIVLSLFASSLITPSVDAQPQTTEGDALYNANVTKFEAWKKTIPDLEQRQYERTKRINNRVLDNTRMIVVILVLQVFSLILLVNLLRRRSVGHVDHETTTQRKGYDANDRPRSKLQPSATQSLRGIWSFIFSEIRLFWRSTFIRTASVIFMNCVLLFVLVNVAFSFTGFETRNIFQAIDESRDNWREYYDIEDLRRVYPDKSDDEILELAVHPSGTGVTYEPYVQSQTESGLNGPVTAAAIHTDGFRLNGRKQASWPIPEDAFNIFVFGGSTTIGVGVQDDETIPAQLQQMLRAKLPADQIGKEINVYNFGSPGYFSLIERVWFETLLLDGVSPDFVVFIDGYNDYHVHAGTPGMTWWITKHFPIWVAAESGEDVNWYFDQILKSLPINIWLESLKKQESLESFSTNFDGSGLTDEYLSDPELLKTILNRYINNKKVTEAIAELNSTDTLFVWQPVSTYKFNGVLPMGKMDGQGLRTRFGYPLMRKYYDEQGFGQNFLWCADIFENETDENLWVDAGIHYNALGGTLIAECITDRLINNEQFLKSISDVNSGRGAKS